MAGSSNRLGGRCLVIAAALAVALCGGCLGLAFGAPAYRYFSVPSPQDAWGRKITQWQERERDAGSSEDPGSPAAVAGSGAGEEAVNADGSPALRAKFEAFRNERRRAQAREVAEWIQSVAQQHYIADGPVDRWATLEETFRHNGDDCDGLELLTFNLLRELGFGADEVYRGIVFRRSDGQHHMVTFWFENPDDPWVIDPTGAMTSGMPHMSEVPGWVPIKVFSEDRDFDVARRLADAHVVAR